MLMFNEQKALNVINKSKSHRLPIANLVNFLPIYVALFSAWLISDKRHVL